MVCFVVRNMPNWDVSACVVCRGVCCGGRYGGFGGRREGFGCCGGRREGSGVGVRVFGVVVFGMMVVVVSMWGLGVVVE